MDTPDPPTVTMTDAPTAFSSDNPAARKSYRRKYRKIMVNFEHRMQESTNLIRDEQKIMDIQQRLAEQNDQLLQLLLDLNSMPQVPQESRYDLGPVDGVVPTYSENKTEYDQESGHKALRKGRYQLQTGEIMPHDYEKLKREILQSPAFEPAKSYAYLVETVSRESLLDPEGGDVPESKSGFLTVTQEEHYHRALDAFLRNEAPTPRGHVNNGLRNGERNIEREKEIHLRNPVSVYNWLRKHNPQVFLQDEDSKPSRTTGARASKRGPASHRDSVIKQEQDLYDDDGIALDVPAGRNRRRRDEDGGYRPKGGATRSAKRKRDSEANVSRIRKKSSIG